MVPAGLVQAWHVGCSLFVIPVSALNSAVYLTFFMAITPVQFRPEQVSIEAGEVQPVSGKHGNAGGQYP